MSLSGVNSDIDDAAVPAEPEPDAVSGRRWSLRELPLPLIGTLIFAGIRVLSVAIAAFLLGNGSYRLRHWSLVRWMRSSDGGHYRAIAAHGYTYPAGQLAHASVFSWFPGYPAVIDSIAWLPGITIVAAATVRSTAVALVLTVFAAAMIAVVQAVRARQPFAAWWRPLAGLLLAP